MKLRGSHARNAWSFNLTIDSVPLEGAEQVATLGDDIEILGEVIPGWEQWGEDMPPISAQRGGTPSSVRSRLGRRIAKHAPEVKDPTALIQELWPCEARSFVEFKGDNDALVKLCRGFIQQYRATHTVHGWKLGKLQEEDPWQKADPWSKPAAMRAMPVARATHHVLDAADAEDADDYEQLDLETTFIAGEKEVLPQYKRVKHSVDKPAVVLCTQQQLPAYIHGLGDSIPVMILVNKLSAEQRDTYKAAKTQIVVKDLRGPKVLTVEAITRGPQAICAVQKAIKVQAIDADVIMATLKVGKAEVDMEDFEHAMIKQNLSLFVGNVFQLVTFTSRRMDDQAETIRWSVECPRAHLAALLACSGHKGCIVQIPREEEQKLNIQAIFVSASSAKAVYDTVKHMTHLGVCGPTKAGLYIVRSPTAEVAALRKVVLSETSAFAHDWNLIVTCRYEGKFPAQYSMQTIGTSLRTSLKWSCITLSQKMIGRKYRLVTLGAAQEPPATQVMFGEEIVLLKRIEEKQRATLATAFQAPTVVGEARMTDTPLRGVSQVLDDACDKRVHAMGNAMEVKMTEWQLATQQKIANQVMSQIDEKLNAKHKEQDQRFSQLTEQLQGTEKTVFQIRNEAKQAWQNSTAQVKSLEQSCKEQFQRVDQVLVEQTQAIQNSSDMMKEQFRSLGTDLMEQIAKMSNEMQAASKRRRPTDKEADQEMEHRGGMEQVAWKHDLLARLRNTLKAHLPVMLDDEDDETEDDETLRGFFRDQHVGGRRVDDLPEEDLAVRPEGAGSSDGNAKADPYQIEEPYRIVVEEQYGGGGDNLRQEPQEQHNPRCLPRDQIVVGNVVLVYPKGVKCSPKNEVDIAEFLAAAWDEAIQHGWHIWTSYKDQQLLLSEVDTLQYIPQARPDTFAHGYTIACWACGLVHHARRRRAVLTTTCAASRLIRHPDPWGMRISARSCTQQGFAQFLQRLNQDPLRNARHWPSVFEKLVEQRFQVWLRCSKCGKEIYHANKHAFLKETCEQDSAVLDALPLPLQHADPQQPLLAAPEIRGGNMCALATLNVGTLKHKEAMLAGLHKDVVMLQETCVAPAKQKSVSTAMAQFGGSIAFGNIAPQDLRESRQGQGVRLGTGIAVLAYKPWSVTKMESRWPATPAARDSSHRLLSTLVTNGSASFVCHVVYCDPQHRDHLEEAIYDTILQRISIVSQVPHVVGGDFQAKAEDTRLGRILAAAGWVSHARLQQDPQHHTHRPHRGEPAVLDDIWFAPQLTGPFRGTSMEWTAAFSTHGILTVSFEFTEEVIAGDVVKPVLPPQKEAEALENPDWQVWDEAVDFDMTSEQLYEEWLSRVNRFLRLPPRMLGRRHTMYKEDRQDGKYPITHRPFYRANLARKVNSWYRELRDLRYRHREGDLTGRAQQLLQAVRQAPWVHWPDQPAEPLLQGMRAWPQLDPLLAWFDESWPRVHECLAQESRHSVTTWKVKFDDAIKTGKLKMVSRWLRPSSSLPLLEHRGQIVMHPRHIGKILRDEWRPIYNPEEMKPMTDDEITYMTQHMERHAWCPGPIIAEELREMARRRTPSTSGPDNLSLALLQVLPLTAWQMVTAVLNKIEEGQPWPPSLLDVNMVAIPRQDSQEIAQALKYRMISISSHIHRTWASLRAAQATRGWLVHVVRGHTFAGLPGKSAKDATLQDAMEWDMAKLEEKDMFAAYLDCSKCFDTLKPCDLLAVAWRMGLSERLCRALQQWYEGHSRTITVKGWLQPAFKTARGVPQGCAVSVLLCALWNSTWSTHMPALLSSGPASLWSCATYMDDFSLMSQSRACLEQALGFTVEHFRLWQVQLNPAKSSLLTNIDREHVEDAHGLQVQRSQRLLGIDTGWMGSHETMKQRLMTARQRLNRLMTMPLPQSSYAKLVMTFVCPLLYGLELGEIDKDVQKLDVAIKRLVWGKARCAACYPAIMALGIASHKITVQGQRFLNVMRGIWRLGSQDEMRRKLLRLWQSRQLPRSFGLWRAFLQELSKHSLRLNVQGGIEDEHRGEVLHLNQHRASWLHQVRQIW